MNKRLALLWRIFDALEEMTPKELLEVLLWLRQRFPPETL